MANIMIRKGDKGYVFYMPKRDIEDSIVSMEFDTPEKWGGEIKLGNGGIYYIDLTDPLSVIHELRSNGVRVPEDMSVAGHDGSDVAASIKLTTMAQPAREIGRIAHNHPDRADARRYDAANRSRIAIGWPADGKGRRTELQPIE